ncbi:MAG TPA: amidohydrolase family protein [Gemmatimonadales bacterium]|nr:amidohydrolase family protein [Gemmatimonadales bacterium]
MRREALEAASLDGAHFLGLDGEIGSITVGKIADLVIRPDGYWNRRPVP